MAYIGIASGSQAAQGLSHSGHHSSRCSQTGMWHTADLKLMQASAL